MEGDTRNPNPLILSGTTRTRFGLNGVVSPSPAPATTSSPVRRDDNGKGKEIVIGGQSREVVKRSNRKTVTARIVSDEEDDGDDEIDTAGGRKRKRNRHNADQVREMEILYSKTSHPSESQRQELGNRLGISSAQVKFWFQNRRTQSKTLNDRTTISSLRIELEALRRENKLFKENAKKALCFNCEFFKDNQQLSSEIRNIRSFTDISTMLHACTTSCLLGMEVSEVMKLVAQATEDLIKIESVCEIANNDKSLLMNSRNESMETINVFVDINSLVYSFMDVNQWKDMFPGLISKGSTIDVLCKGEWPNINGVVQMMSAEFQMLSPSVPSKILHFIRHCRRLNSKKWVIVNFTVNNNLNMFGTKLDKRPWGCTIEDISDGHCKVTWIEHSDSELISIGTKYPLIINATFSARHWTMALQQHCEQSFYNMASTFPLHESNVYENRGGLVSTLAERTNIMLLAHKMTINFCRSIASSNLHKFTKLTSKDEDEVRVSFKRNLNEPGEPDGLIICALTSVWLPISRLALLNYLRDSSHRHEWDLTMNGEIAQSLVTLTKGSNNFNSVTIQRIEGQDETKILQDSSSNEFESMLVFSPMSTSSLKSNYTEEVTLLASGFSILRNGMDSKEMELEIESGGREKEGGGCLITLAFQLMASPSPIDEVSVEAVEDVTRLVSFTLRNIKDVFKCE